MNAEGVEAARRRFRELTDHWPAPPIETMQNVIAFENHFIQVENNKVHFRKSNANGTYLRINPARGRPGGVVVLPVLADGQVIFVAHYRYALEKWSLEFPRGFGEESDKNPLVTATRELREETGLIGAEWRELGTVHADTGLQSATLTVMLATGCTPQGGPHLEEEESVAGTIAVSADTADSLAAEGDIQCGITLSALYLYRASTFPARP